MKRPGRPHGTTTCNRLREFRLRPSEGRPNGYTVAEIAEYLGVAYTSVSNAELYGRGLGRKKIYRLADLYEVDPRILEAPPAEKILPIT